jgi:hydroxyethylthiazole kinase-like uncharacterized protein yjeF
MKIVTAEQMRQIEQECAKAGLPPDVLMENAGKAFAEEVRRIAGELDKHHILCLIGPGNNGGDGLVAARYFQEWGAKTSVYLCAKRPDADKNLALVKERAIPCIDGTEDKDLNRFSQELSSATIVIDALFGTGKVRPLKDIYQQALDRVSEIKNKNRNLAIISLDLPSGLDANSGAIDPQAPYADFTITLGFPKAGLFLFPGAERVGMLRVVNIGIPARLADSITAELLTDEWAKTFLPKRPRGANKGTFGKVMVVAGSINYIGAAYLACSGALRVGAGLVTLATAASLQPVLAAKLTETTYLPLPEIQPGVISLQAGKIISNHCADYNALLIGCGLGQHQPTIDFVNTLTSEKKLPPLVLDADALNILARTQDWWREVVADAILTPHPGEMCRLAGMTMDAVQSDRMGTAIKMAQKWQKVVVLKGAYTIITEPGGRVKVSPFANPGLASAGTGDVLSGAIAGLVAQGLSLFDAASLGVYLHGKAGEAVRSRLGDAGMVAGDLLPELPLVIKQLKER